MFKRCVCVLCVTLISLKCPIKCESEMKMAKGNILLNNVWVEDSSISFIFFIVLHCEHSKFEFDTQFGNWYDSI